MNIEEVIHEIMPKVRELEEECSNLTFEEFECTREAILNDVSKSGDQRVIIIIMQSMLSVIYDNLKTTVWNSSQGERCL